MWEKYRRRFNQYWNKVQFAVTVGNGEDLYQSFLRESRTGESAAAPSLPKLFDALATHHKMKWFKSLPLCNIECIQYEFGNNPSMWEIADTLVSYAAQTECGKGWECLLVAGIYIWCLDTKINPVLRGDDGKQFRL